MTTLKSFIIEANIVKPRPSETTALASWTNICAFVEDMITLNKDVNITSDSKRILDVAQLQQTDSSIHIRFDGEEVLPWRVLGHLVYNLTKLGTVYEAWGQTIKQQGLQPGRYQNLLKEVQKSTANWEGAKYTGITIFTDSSQSSS
ncbi:MAG: hypothetical protein GY861_24150 [bacterium]|nr:hypothetical protein [bacterium]